MTRQMTRRLPWRMARPMNWHLPSLRTQPLRYRLPLLVALFALALAPAGAQVTRLSTLRIKPKATGGDTLTVMATPTAVSFALVEGGVAPGSTSISIVTATTGLSLISSFSLSAYFASSAHALQASATGPFISSSAVFGKVPTGSPTSFTAFTQSAPLGPAGSGLLLFSQTTLISLGGSRTDVLSLQIDLTSFRQTPAATYTGTLTIQAQAF